MVALFNLKAEKFIELKSTTKTYENSIGITGVVEDALAGIRSAADILDKPKENGYIPIADRGKFLIRSPYCPSCYLCASKLNEDQPRL